MITDVVLALNEPPLSNKNFTLYAAKHYVNPQCFSDEEFLEDVQRIENLKKLFKRFSNGVAQEKNPEKLYKLIRILLNNVIIFNNVFASPAAVRMLFFKIPEYRSELKTILTFISLMPDYLNNLGEEEAINNSDIPIHAVLADYLRKL